jgi:hypothetical protein
VSDPNITAIMADRLQRFIPVRQTAEDVADAMQEDLEHYGYWIGGPGGIRVITGKRLCSRCREPIEHEELIFQIRPRWWQVWKFSEYVHERCLSLTSPKIP